MESLIENIADGFFEMQSLFLEQMIYESEQQEIAPPSELEMDLMYAREMK